MFMIRYRTVGDGNWITLAKTPLETQTEALLFARAKIATRYGVSEITVTRYAAHIWMVSTWSAAIGFVKVTQL